MRFDKFTAKAQESIQNAQEIAEKKGGNIITVQPDKKNLGEFEFRSH
jgi:hypothetical protein